MSTSVSSVVSHFPDAENGFTTTTAGSVSSGAATVTLNSVAGYTNGEPVVLVIDPTDASKKQTFTGIVDTAGVQITSVVWTAGTNQTHALGATVVDYATATHIAMISKGIKVGHTQKGNHKTLTDDNANEWIELGTTASAVNQVKISNAATATGPTIEANGDDTNIDLVIKPKGTGKIKPGFLDGWSYNTLPAVSSVTNNGNRSYDVTFASTVASYLTPGMRIRTSRTVASPTQSTSLNGTTQYYSKSSPAGMTFTDDFVVSAWVKLTSYGNTCIASRYDGTSGWSFEINSSGQLILIGYSGGAANFRYVQSYQSVPLNKWVHLAAELDMSGYSTVSATTSYTMMDGVDVPASMGQGGTNPASLTQAGSLQIGAKNAGNFFPGKIAQVAIYNAKVTQATILASINQTLSGSETSLISAYSFNNTINDLNANANNLTANGSAVATNADSPFSLDANGTPGGTYDFGIVTKVATTVATVQVPEGCTIPTSGGVSAVDLSAYKSPFGFPAQIGRWVVGYVGKISYVQSAPVASTWYNMTSTSGTTGGLVLTVPVGAWNLTYYSQSQGSTATNTSEIYSTLSTGASSETDIEFSDWKYAAIGGAASADVVGTLSRSKPVDVSSATPYYLNHKTTIASTNIRSRGDVDPVRIEAIPAHL